MKQLKVIAQYSPTIGIVAFCVIYIYASWLYPGGSEANPNFVGFDWLNNYWCNLTKMTAINGVVNPARPIAIMGLIILCASVLCFFVQVANQLMTQHFWKRSTKIFGTSSMLIAMFIFTEQHDLMISISSVLGVFVVFAIGRAVYLSRLELYKLTGIICVLLLALNNLIYYSEIGLKYLPLVQKITFVIVLAWMIGLNFALASKRFSMP